MALGTTGTAYIATFLSPTSANWKALAPIPGYNTGALADAVSNGWPLVIYVIDAASGTFAFPGGQATGFDDTITSLGSPLSGLSVTSSVGGTTRWLKTGSGTVYTYSDAMGVLQTYDAGELAALKAFL